MRTLPLLLTIALFVCAAQVQAADLIVRAVDEDGHAISKFEVKGIGIGTTFTWTRSRADMARLDRLPLDSLTIIVRSDGFATAVKYLPAEITAGERGWSCLRPCKPQLKHFVVVSGRQITLTIQQQDRLLGQPASSSATVRAGFNSEWSIIFATSE